MRSIARTLFLSAVVLTTSAIAASTPVFAQGARKGFARPDTLRGTNTPERRWWDAQFYDLHVRVNPSDSTIRGHNGISYRVIKPASIMQIDLQQPMMVDSV
ncbi:MAG: M1 family peptidase, partial [Gemmatimonas sp.]